MGKRRNKVLIWIFLYLCVICIIWYVSGITRDRGSTFSLPDDAYPVPLAGSYYDLLDGPDKRLYGTIQQAVEQSLSGSLDFVDTGIDLQSEEERFIRIAHMVLYDNPRYSVVWSTCAVTTAGRKFRISVTCDTDIVPDSVYLKRLLLLEGGSELETAWNVFCYLSKRVTYDTTYGEHSNDDYGAMVLSKACCQGISFAYKRFMDLAGIPCVVLTGYTGSGEYHMINGIRIDGNWYLCDVTSVLQRKPDKGFCMDKETVQKNVFGDIVYVPQHN